MAGCQPMTYAIVLEVVLQAEACVLANCAHIVCLWIVGIESEGIELSKQKRPMSARGIDL